MPQPNFSEFSDHPPRRERRSPLPITNLPVNAISEPSDPTQEIRTLIEELQKTARDARSQARFAESERDELERQLEDALAKVEQLRANERELRSHFTEVTTILHERDEAVRARDRMLRVEKESAEKISILSRERNDFARQRDDAIHQRDEVQRTVEGLKNAAAEASARVAEAQRQVTAIRQARDNAHAQNLELTNKAARLEDEVAELGYQRDAAKKAQQQIQAEAAEHRRQLDMMTSDRDATAAQVEQLTAELDVQRKKLLDLAEQRTVEVRADNDQSEALAEARAQMASLVQERDAARQRMQEQARELEEIRAQFHNFRDVESQTISRELEEARAKFAALETHAREARHEAKNLQQQVVAFREQIAGLQQVLEETAVQKREMEERLASLGHEHEAAARSSQNAREEVEQVKLAREQDRQAEAARLAALEEEIASLRTQLAAVDEVHAFARDRQEQLDQANRRSEKQRLETLEIVTQLQSAQREVRELSASLAEARLQVKFANSAARAVKAAPERVAEITSLATEAVHESLAEAALARQVILPDLDEPVSEKEARSAFVAMRQCFQEFTRNPLDLSHLNELHCHVHAFSERARVSGFVALHRLCHVFAELTRGLYETPERINESTTRTVGETIEFLMLLARERLLASLNDPASARIYIVDDDPENCQAIQMTLEEQMLQAAVALEPSCAILELASEHFDLIFLDVVMPEMDGFELCRQIRELPFHRHTPIVFLTGVNSAENRTQSDLSGGTDFLGKPFDLAELSVKALTLILRGQLTLA